MLKQKYGESKASRRWIVQYSTDGTLESDLSLDIWASTLGHDAIFHWTRTGIQQSKLAFSKGVGVYGILSYIGGEYNFIPIPEARYLFTFHTIPSNPTFPTPHLASHPAKSQYSIPHHQGELTICQPFSSILPCPFASPIPLSLPLIIRLTTSIPTPSKYSNKAPNPVVSLLAIRN